MVPSVGEWPRASVHAASGRAEAVGLRRADRWGTDRGSDACRCYRRMTQEHGCERPEWQSFSTPQAAA
eukprot:3356558-Prymnesium_polylepis.1